MGLFAVIILVINVVAVTLPMGLVMTAASKSGLDSLSDKLLEVSRRVYVTGIRASMLMCCCVTGELGSCSWCCSPDQYVFGGASSGGADFGGIPSICRHVDQ